MRPSTSEGLFHALKGVCDMTTISISNSKGTDLEVPSLPIGDHPLLEAFRQRLLEQLAFASPGAVFCKDYQALQPGEDFYLGDEHFGMIGVVGYLNPAMFDEMEEQLTYMDKDQEEELRPILDEIRGLVNVDRSCREVVGDFHWLINGWCNSWTGSIFVSSLDEEWCSVTCAYERDLGAIDSVPFVIGFVKRDCLSTGVPAIVRATIGWFIARPTEIRWDRLSAADAVRIAVNGLDRSDHDDFLVDTALEEWSSTYSQRSLQLKDLPREVVETDEKRILLRRMERKFEETMTKRRRRQRQELPLRSPIEPLSDDDHEKLARWFALERGERLKAFNWRPFGIRYHSRTPTVYISIERRSSPILVYFQERDAPTLGAVIAGLPAPEPGPPLQPWRESIVAHADHLWACGFPAEAGKAYRAAVRVGDFRARLAVLGHFLSEGMFAEAKDLVESLHQSVEKMQGEAANEFRRERREGKFLAALALKRDLLRASAVMHLKLGNEEAALRALGPWRPLVAELGEGPDPFAAP